MKARTLALLLTAVVVVYLVLLAQRGVLLLSTGTAVGIGLGLGVLLLPVVGLWIAWANLRFGIRAEKLTNRLAAEGGLPDTSELPRRPSGRVERAAADAYFEQVRTAADAEPDDWRGWYRLAHAYDLAGDRRRAREAMRHAITLAGHQCR